MHTRNLVSVSIFSSILEIAREHNSKHCSDSLKYKSIYVLQQAREVSLALSFGLYLWEIKVRNVLGSWHSCYMKWKPLLEQFKCSSIVPLSLSGPIKCILLQMHMVNKCALLFLLTYTNSSKLSAPNTNKVPKRHAF